jgi:hypothetical protein
MVLEDGNQLDKSPRVAPSNLFTQDHTHHQKFKPTGASRFVEIKYALRPYRTHKHYKIGPVLNVLISTQSDMRSIRYNFCIERFWVCQGLPSDKVSRFSQPFHMSSIPEFVELFLTWSFRSSQGMSLWLLVGWEQSSLTIFFISILNL